ncbi:hypothetical protein M758_5G051200 [Ceratodon purpureus]|nr:hypothetical protein M758_5G051200 [Ceratodon purpureus]
MNNLADVFSEGHDFHHLNSSSSLYFQDRVGLPAGSLGPEYVIRVSLHDTHQHPRRPQHSTCSRITSRRTPDTGRCEVALRPCCSQRYINGHSLTTIIHCSQATAIR